MILKENEFYYNKDINELFIISKDESDINDKINKFYYKKLIERNLDYHSLNDDLYYNLNLRFDLIDSENIYFSNIYNGVRKNLPVEALEFSYIKIKDFDEVTLLLETFIDRDVVIRFLEGDNYSKGLAMRMAKDFYKKDLIYYNEHKNDLDTLSNLLEEMLKEENDGNIKIFINGIDIFEPHAYFRKLEDEKEIKNYLVKKNFK